MRISILDFHPIFDTPEIVISVGDRRIGNGGSKTTTVSTTRSRLVGR